MYLYTNEIETDEVRHEERDGREFVVAPVVLMRAMELNGGYVPREHVAASAPRWNGEPVPVTHPEDGGRPISIRDERAGVPVIGFVDNVEARDGGERLVGEVWIDVERAREVGGEAARVVTRLENGDAVEVSTGYFAEPLPPGVYDGARRDEVQGNLRPDHLAVLPSEKGMCSIADGCGAGAPMAVANAAGQLRIATVAGSDADADDGSAAGQPEDDGQDHGQNESQDRDQDMHQNQRSEARRPEFDGTETSDWSSVEKSLSNYLDGYFEHTGADRPDEAIDSVGEAPEAAREWIAARTLLGVADAGSVDELLVLPVVNPGTDQLNAAGVRNAISRAPQLEGVSEAAIESAQAMGRRLLDEEFGESQNVLRRAYNELRNVFGPESTADEPAESGTGAASSTSDMGDKTEELVENHGFDADNLPDEDTECFDRIYETFVNEQDGTDADGDDSADADDSADDSTDTDHTDHTDHTDQEDVLTRDEAQELVADAVEEALAANRDEQRREELINEIVANTDRDRDDLGDLDADALAVLADELPAAGAASFVGQRGARPAAGSSDDAEMPALSARERAVELGLEEAD